MMRSRRTVAACVALVFSGILISLAVNYIRKRRGSSREHADIQEMDDQSTEDVTIKIKLQTTESEDILERNSVDRDVPRAPPPSRNLSRTELPKGDSLEEDIGLGHRSPCTPPPSRSMSSGDLTSADYTINEIEDSGGFLMPPGVNKDRKRSSGGQAITDEVAAAMSLSLGAQGYGDSGDDDTPVNDEGPIPVAQSLVNGRESLCEVSENEIRETMTFLEAGHYENMTSTNAKVLNVLIRSSTPEQQENILVHIANSAAFTRNQNLLREAGCLERLSSLLKAHVMAMRVSQQVTYPSLVNKAISTVNNLAVNQHNQTRLQDSIPALIEFVTGSSTPKSVQLSSLQALTNLSLSPDNHEPYTKVIQQLYEALDQASPDVQLQALKVLVNLSTNPDMVPHLLAAKAPNCLLTLLVPSVDENLVLRWVTILANIMNEVKDKNISAESLPTDHKAASPETMFTAIYGVAAAAKLRSKIFVLSKHEHQEIRTHAARIYSCLG